MRSRQPGDRRRIRVEILADCQVCAVIPTLTLNALVAGPTEVLDDRICRIRNAVDFLPITPADVADPDLAGSWPDREPERIPKPVRHDASRAIVRIAEQRVVWERRARVRIDANNGAAERHQVAGGSHILTAERTTLIRRIPRRKRIRCGRGRRPVVHVVEAGSITSAGVQRAVSPKSEAANGVTRELLPPVLDEHLLLCGAEGSSGETAKVQPRESGRHDAAIPSWTRTVVVLGFRLAAPTRWRKSGQHGVEGIEDVDVRRRREVGVKHHPEHPAVPVVVNVDSQIDHQRRGGVGQTVVDVDTAALVGDVHPTVRGELQHGRIFQAGLRQRDILKPWRRRGERPADGRHQIAGQIARAADRDSKTLAASQLVVGIERCGGRRRVIGHLRGLQHVTRVSELHHQRRWLNGLAEGRPRVDLRRHAGRVRDG